MNHQLICSWLGLPADTWPPDHYRLLGLEPGEDDVVLIEQRVQQRLDAVRRYQMTHPDLATEAMNRLAQALVSLTATRRPSRTRLPARPPAEPPPLPVPAAEPAEAPPEYVETADWHAPPPVRVETTDWHSPPPVRNGSASAVPPPVRNGSASAVPPPLPAPPAPPTMLLAASDTVTAMPPGPLAIDADATPLPGRRWTEAPTSPKVDPAKAAARSKTARRSLGTIRAVCRRARLTRQLLLEWESLGDFLATRRRLRGPADEDELHDSLAETLRLLRGFPPILGHAGQPAYLITSLARQHDPVATYRQLTTLQRVALQRDWHAGLTLLRAHHAFLLDELRALRRLSRRERLVRAVRTILTDQPAVTGILVILLLINLVLWGTYLPYWLGRH
jgi:hypothetical protein